MGPSEFFDLTGKVAVVTGGSRGMGRSMVKAFAAAGADVVIASRKLENCEALAKEVEAETGRTAMPVAVHVGHWDECDALVDAVYERFGKCDVFVNNAGMSPLYPDLVSVTEELFDKVVGVNLKGPFRLGVLAGKRMYEAGSGSIINVSTIGSLLASVGELPYASAKAGLNAFTVGLAEALAPKVRVNCILPGAFATDITEPWSDEMKSGKMVPLKRLGDPDEIVGTALYLASDTASSYTTGALIRVDGGMARKV
jgi:NAD(P)-dependent dehydrogenase (short-subunit alcohol dehydrogenase family)